MRQNKNSTLLINTISIVIVVAVAVLISIPYKIELGDWTKQLAHAIGIINSLTTVVLITGLIFIKNNKVHLHRAAMTTAFVLGILFLVCYVTYHISNPANQFKGEGFVRPIYFFMLISHVGLSLIVLPFVLRAMYYAVTKNFTAHKKIVKYAFPLWLYVSVSGVIVYLMLYQLFPAK